MRTFGTDTDNLIDEELEYGNTDYELVWYKNGSLININVTKVIFHFVGSKIPIGHVTKDYIEIETDYMDFYKGDAIQIDIKKNGKTLTIGTFYVDILNKKNDTASYTAFSSLLNLNEIKLTKYECEESYAYISDVVNYYFSQLGITFNTSYFPSVDVAYIVDGWESLTIQDLAECVAFSGACNFTLQGTVLNRKSINNTVKKVYRTEDVVYSNSKTKHEEDKYLDSIKINYTDYIFTNDGLQCEDATYVIAPYGTTNNQVVLNFKFIPFKDHMNSITQFYDELIKEDKVLLNDYTVSFLGDPRIEIGDVISFKSEDGSICTFRVGELTWVWDGGLKCTASTGSAVESISSSGGYTSVQQIADAIVSMSNSLMSVRYNAVYTNELYAKVAELGFASIDELSAEVAKMGYMTADEADIRYLTAESASLKYATIDSLNVLQGNFNTLNAKAVTTDTLNAEVAKLGYVETTQLEASVAELGYLKAGTADLKYASIDLSNIEAGTIQTAMIATGAIGTAQIADGSITDAKIVGLTANKITAGTLDAATIEVVNLNAANITVGTINGHQISSGAISLDNLGSDVTDKLAATESDVAAAVADAKKAILNSSQAVSDASNALKTANSASSTASTANTNANNAVNTSNTAKNTAESAKTTADANADVILSWCKDNNTLYIDGSKLYAGTVLSDAIASNAIVADKIASNAVTAVKISSGAITTDKLAANAVTAAKIAAGTITATQIAANTITGSKIASGTISATNIASNAITADKIVSSAITAAKISSGAITTDKLAANAVTAAKIAAGTITATQIAAGTITGDKIAAGTISADKLNVDELFSKNIKFTGSIVSTASIVKNNVCEYSKVEINKADLSNDSGNDVLYIGYAGNIPHAIGGTNTPKYYKVFSVTSKGKIDICAPTYNDASITVTHDSNIAGDQTIFSECYSKITPYGIDSIASYIGQSTVYNSGYNASGFAIRTENNGKYERIIEAFVDDDNLILKLSNTLNSKSIEFDGNTGTIKADNINGYKLAAACARGVLTRDSVGDCGYSTTSNRTNLADGNMLAYWNGAYSGTSSNLAYCNKGAFGTIVTKNAGDYFPNSGGSFNTATGLLINGNALNYQWAQLLIESNGLYFGIRNDGGNTYLMHGSSSGWSNYSRMDSTGAWYFANWVISPQVRVTGQTSAGTTANPNCYIDTAGTIYKSSKTSSRRFKDDIKPVENDDLNPERLYDVEVIQFKYKKDYFTNEEDVRYRKDMIGFIAEDIYDKYKIAADYHVDEDSGEVLVDGWNEQYLIPAMLKLIQELNTRVIYLEKNMKG